jgi:hypothetical protein
VIQFTIGEKIAAGSCERMATTLTISLQLANATDSYLTGSPGPLSSGGCGRASPVVPGGRSLLVCLVSTRWMVVANAAIIATPRTAAKIAKVICVRRRLLQLGSLFMDNTLSNIDQRNCVGPVPPSTRLGTGSPPRHCHRGKYLLEAATSYPWRSAISRPEADQDMADHDAACIGGWRSAAC